MLTNMVVGRFWIYNLAAIYHPQEGNTLHRCISRLEFQCSEAGGVHSCCVRPEAGVGLVLGTGVCKGGWAHGSPEGNALGAGGH